MASDRKICIGMIAGAHGIRGLVRIRSFTEAPQDIASYGDLTDESGEQAFVITLKDVVKDCFTASIKGVDDRNTAEELHGVRLYVARDKMPKTKKQEYYASDLIGLAARDNAGNHYGTVMDVHDHGAGTFLEIGKTRRDSFMLPFTGAYVPKIDVDNSSVQIVLPEGWLKEEKPEYEEGSVDPLKTGKKLAKTAKKEPSDA